MPSYTRSFEISWNNLLLISHHFIGIWAKVESNSFCRKVLEARQRDNLLPRVPIHKDVTTLKGSEAKDSGAQGCGGGFPCQARRERSFRDLNGFDCI